MKSVWFSSFAAISGLQPSKYASTRSDKFSPRLRHNPTQSFVIDAATMESKPVMKLQEAPARWRACDSPPKQRAKIRQAHTGPSQGDPHSFLIDAVRLQPKKVGAGRRDTRCAVPWKQLIRYRDDGRIEID